MTDIAFAEPTVQETGRRDYRAAGRFAWHYVQMLIAMAVGMAVLMPLWSLALRPTGIELTDHIALHAMVMATDMSLGMGAWMRWRGHGWRSISEMSAAMYLPFALVLVPYWLGALTAVGVMTAGHLLMLPAMLIAMLLRREEYSHAHHAQSDD
jgi:hypothetical protein